MKRIVFLCLMIVSLTSSCHKKKDFKSTRINNKSLKTLAGHTYYYVQEKGEYKSIYQPCDANIEKYIIYNDSIFHDLGQEFYTFKILSHKNINNKHQYVGQYVFAGISNNKEAITFQAVDQKNIYWKINGKLFIDSIYYKTIPFTKQRCEECYDGCEEKKIEDSLKDGKWSTDCDDPIGVTINGNQLIICVEPNNYYIHLTKIEEKNDLSNIIKYKINRLEGIGSQEIYSDSYINDREIAIIKILSDNKIEFDWLGFYNKKNKERQYSTPLISNSNPSILEKCY